MIHYYQRGTIIKEEKEQSVELVNQIIPYEELVVQLIREKYTLDDELAIQRQKETKHDEWEAYFAYCEECKAKAKEKVGDTNG